MSLKEQITGLGDEDTKVFDEIFQTYIESILDSVDTAQAASIYAGAIAEGLPASEIKAATDFYGTPEGQRLLQVVGAASAKLNQYILDQMAASTKLTQAQMITSLEEFTISISAAQE